MWTRSVSFAYSRPCAGQFVAARPGISRHVKTRVVVRPINQAVLEYWIGPCDPLRNRHSMADLARRLRNRDINGAQSMTIPGVEHDIFENSWIVILVCDSPARLTIGFRDVLVQAFIELIVGDREGANHDRHDLGFD